MRSAGIVHFVRLAPGAVRRQEPDQIGHRHGRPMAIEQPGKPQAAVARAAIAGDSHHGEAAGKLAEADTTGPDLRTLCGHFPG